MTSYITYLTEMHLMKVTLVQSTPKTQAVQQLVEHGDIWAQEKQVTPSQDIMLDCGVEYLN